MRYPDTMQALVDYAAGAGAATLEDDMGRVVVGEESCLGTRWGSARAAACTR